MQIRIYKNKRPAAQRRPRTNSTVRRRRDGSTLTYFCLVCSAGSLANMTISTNWTTASYIFWDSNMRGERLDGSRSPFHWISITRLLSNALQQTRVWQALSSSLLFDPSCPQWEHPGEEVQPIWYKYWLKQPCPFSNWVRRNLTWPCGLSIYC